MKIKPNGKYEFRDGERGFFQNKFLKMLHTCGIKTEQATTFKNCVFEYHDYNWGTEEDGIFFFKPLNLQVTFYKYPLRSAEFDKDISTSNWRYILNVCKASMYLEEV